MITQNTENIIINIGEMKLYSGITGKQLKTSIFIGPTYYQRLKIMVADKMIEVKDPYKSYKIQPP